MFKVNKKNIRRRCEICLKLTIETPERSQSVKANGLAVEVVVIKAAISWIPIFKQSCRMIFFKLQPSNINIWEKNFF